MVPETMLDQKADALLAPATPVDAKSARMLARAFYKGLRDGGYTPQQVLAASGEILELVTADLRARGETPPADA